MRIELNCAECGRNRFTLSRFDDDNTEIECVDCGHKIGTMAQLKSRLADEVMKRATNASDQG
jgi:DNA-directed RNA polymerase subunit RPC12/RpoP